MSFFFVCTSTNFFFAVTPKLINDIDIAVNQEYNRLEPPDLKLPEPPDLKLHGLHGILKEAVP